MHNVHSNRLLSSYNEPVDIPALRVQAALCTFLATIMNAELAMLHRHFC